MTTGMLTVLSLLVPSLLAAGAAVWLARSTRLKDAPRLDWGWVVAIVVAGLLLPILARAPFALATGRSWLPIWAGTWELWVAHAVPVALTAVVARVYGRAIPSVAIATGVGALALPAIFHAACPFLEGSSDSAMGIALLFGLVYFAVSVAAPVCFVASVIVTGRRR